MTNRPIIVRPNPIIVRCTVRGVCPKSSGNRQVDAANCQIARNKSFGHVEKRKGVRFCVFFICSLS